MCGYVHARARIEARRRCYILGAGDARDYEPLGCWELNLCPLQEQLEPSLQPPQCVFKAVVIIIIQMRAEDSQTKEGSLPASAQKCHTLDPALSGSRDLGWVGHLLFLPVSAQMTH